MTGRGDPVVEIVEVGGRGGVFHHTVALAELLAAAGRAPLVHTATDHEALGADVDYCPCFTWHRRARGLRPLRIALSFLLRTTPHLARGRRRVVWVQGLFKPGLTLLLLTVLRRRGIETVFSPHNLFSRTGSRVEELLIRRCVRAADHVVAYNAVDHARLRGLGRRAWLLPLVQYAPPVPAETLRQWRARLPRGPVVSAVGQIRADKNLPLLVEAAARAGVAVVVVGPDAGALQEVRRRAAEVGADVRFHAGYRPLEDLAAVLTLTGVVVCPYTVASQSGVARLARSYGAVVVAADVGGLGEQADVVVGRPGPEALAEALLAGVRERRTRTPAAAGSGGPPAPAGPFSAAEARAVHDLVGALGGGTPGDSTPGDTASATPVDAAPPSVP